MPKEEGIFKHDRDNNAYKLGMLPQAPMRQKLFMIAIVTTRKNHHVCNDYFLCYNNKIQQ
jgi:hypothetical protein